MALRNLESVALPLDQFAFDNFQLSAEASELQWNGQLQQLYNDAADVGIAVRSHKTGIVAYFYLDRIERNDGDLLAWHFLPVPENKRTPATRVRSIVIFND